MESQTGLELDYESHTNNGLEIHTYESANHYRVYLDGVLYAKCSTEQEMYDCINYLEECM